MSVAITEPAGETTNIIQAYRPVGYRIEVQLVEASFDRAEFVELVEVDVLWNGESIGVMRKSWNSRNEFVAGTWDYVFDIDVQRLVQDNLLPKTSGKSGVFGEIGEEREGDNPDDGWGELEISVEVLYRDDDNLLKVLAGGATVSDYEVVCVPLALRHEELQYLWGVGRYVWNGDGNVKCLTNIPEDGCDISVDENGWLSAIAYNLDSYRVSLYDSDGDLISVKIKDLGASGEVKKVVVVGSGAVQIDALTGLTGWDYDIDDVYINTGNVDYYVIEFGVWSGGSSFTARTDGVRYNVKKRGEERSFRLHFLNRLGGGDAYTFDCKRVRKLTVSSSRGKKSLGWDYEMLGTGGEHEAEDMGVFRYGLRQDEAYELESKRLIDSEGRWLEELDGSVEVYYEDLENGELIRGVVDDVSDVVTEDSDEGVGVVKKLVFRMANGVIRQRY